MRVTQANIGTGTLANEIHFGDLRVFNVFL